MHYHFDASRLDKHITLVEIIAHKVPVIRPGPHLGKLGHSPLTALVRKSKDSAGLEDQGDLTVIQCNTGTELGPPMGKLV